MFAVDELMISGRIREIRREIAEIGTLNRDYLAGGNSPHCGFGTSMYEQRRQRLQEIKEELAALLRRSAA